MGGAECWWDRPAFGDSLSVLECSLLGQSWRDGSSLLTLSSEESTPRVQVGAEELLFVGEYLTDFQTVTS